MEDKLNVDPVPEIDVITDATDKHGTDIVSGDDVIGDPKSLPGELHIPENWEQPIKDFINSIEDPNARKIHFDKFKSFDDGFNKKMSDLSDQRKTFESERKAFDDDRNFLSAYRGFEKSIDQADIGSIAEKFGGVPQYMNYLYQMDRMASSSPAEFIIKYCKSVGIDSMDALEHMLNGPQAQKMGAAMDSAQLEQKLTRQVEERLAIERETAKLEAQIDAFSKNPDYPFFAQVRNRMAELAKYQPNLSLAELYDQAVWTDPAIRAQLQNQSMVAGKHAEAAAVAKAKAAIGVHPAVKTGEPKPNESWRATLARLTN